MIKGWLQHNRQKKGEKEIVSSMKIMKKGLMLTGSPLNARALVMVVGADCACAEHLTCTQHHGSSHAGDTLGT